MTASRLSSFENSEKLKGILRKINNDGRRGRLITRLKELEAELNPKKLTGTQEPHESQLYRAFREQLERHGTTPDDTLTLVSLSTFLNKVTELTHDKLSNMSTSSASSSTSSALSYDAGMMQLRRDEMLTLFGLEINDLKPFHEYVIQAGQKTKPDASKLATSVETKLSGTGPESFREQFKNSETYKLIKLYIDTLKGNPDVEATDQRVKYWETLLNIIATSDDGRWYEALRTYYAKRENEMDEGKTDPKKTDPSNDGTAESVRLILENSKIDSSPIKLTKTGVDTGWDPSPAVKIPDDFFEAPISSSTSTAQQTVKKTQLTSFMLMSMLLRDANKFVAEKNPSLKPSLITQRYQYLSLKERNELLNKTPEEQAQRTVNVIKTFVTKQPPQVKDADEARRIKKAQDILKRVFLLMQAGKIIITDKSGQQVSDLATLNTDSQYMPKILADIFGHGGRVLVQRDKLQKGEDPNNLLYWIFGGANEVSNKITGHEAAAENRVVYTRETATHAISVIKDKDTGKEIVKEETQKVGAVADLAMLKLTEKARHYAVDLGLKDENESANCTGGYGHLYFCAKEATESEPGGILIGIEGGAVDVMNYFSSIHNRTAESAQLSPTGCIKTTALPNTITDSTNQTKQVIKPSGGYKVEINDLTNVLNRSVNEFDPAQLSQPAHLQLPPLPKKIVTPTKSQFDHYIEYTKPSFEAKSKKIAEKTKTYNQMDDVNPLFLGGMPTTEIASQMSKQGKKMTFISVSEMFEFASSSGSQPLTPNDYAAMKDAQQLIFPLDKMQYTDSMTLTPKLEIMLAAAKAIDDAVKRGDVVYVSCRSGNTNSAMVMALYYALYGHTPELDNLRAAGSPKPQELLKEAIKHIEQKRTTVRLTESIFNQALSNSSSSAASSSDNKIIGEIKLANAAIELHFTKEKMRAQAASQTTVTSTLTSPQPIDRSHSGTHFWNELTQSLPFKQLILYCIVAEKNHKLGLLAPRLQELLNLLQNDPVQAFESLKKFRYFGGDNTDRNLFNEIEFYASTNDPKCDKVNDGLGHEYDIKRIFIDLHNFVYKYDHPMALQPIAPSISSTSANVSALTATSSTASTSSTPQPSSAQQAPSISPSSSSVPPPVRTSGDSQWKGGSKSIPTTTATPSSSSSISTSTTQPVIGGAKIRRSGDKPSSIGSTTILQTALSPSASPSSSAPTSTSTPRSTPPITSTPAVQSSSAAATTTARETRERSSGKTMQHASIASMSPAPSSPPPSDVPPPLPPPRRVVPAPARPKASTPKTPTDTRTSGNPPSSTTSTPAPQSTPTTKLPGYKQ